MDFIAIDFETANNSRSSACSLGLVYVKDGEIQHTEYFLFKPTPFFFTNSHIHGIQEADVLEMPTFCESWDYILNKIEGSLIVAHNAAFDLSVMRASLEESAHDFPRLDYVCTWRLSQILMSEMPNHKLSTLANRFGLELNHHNALSDAEVCAQLALHLVEKSNEESLISLSKKCGFNIGELHENNTYSPFAKRRYSRDKTDIVKFDSLVDLESINEKTEKLSGCKIVVSGVFHQFSRSELKKMIEQHGGKNVGSISKKTTFVLAGEKMGPAKKEKAETLGVPLLTEDEFLKKIS
jgi:DNA polymerase-3 subunit epsilon